MDAFKTFYQGERKLIWKNEINICINNKASVKKKYKKIEQDFDFIQLSIGEKVRQR